MKSPFAILLAAVVLLGVGIGIVAIVFLGPDDSDSEETVPIASEVELPTPTTRNRPSQPESGSARVPTDAVVVSTVVSAQKVSSDELPADLQKQIESGEAQIVTTVEVTNEARGDQGGRGFVFRGAGAGGGGPGNFEALQEAIESNPEIETLIEKAQAGNMSQTDQARLRELMQEVLSEAGLDPPAGGQGGFGFQPVQGKITSIVGSAFTVEHADDGGTTTDVQVGEETNITLIRELTQGDLAEDDHVSGVVQRGEGGKINILALIIVPDVPRGGFGLRGAGAAAFGGSGTNVASVEGSISAIEGDTVHLETDQGTLRLTVTDDTMITSSAEGAISDLAENTSVIVIGPTEAGAVQARNVVAGPEALLSQGAGFLGTAGRRGQGQ